MTNGTNRFTVHKISEISGTQTDSYTDLYFSDAAETSMNAVQAEFSQFMKHQGPFLLSTDNKRARETVVMNS